VQGTQEHRDLRVVTCSMFDPLGLAREIRGAASFERRVLDELHVAIGFDAAFVAMKGDPPTTINVDAARLDAAIANAAYASEIAQLKDAARTSGGVAVDTAVLGEKAVQKLRYHRDFAAAVRGRHTLFAFLSLRGHGVGGLMLGRSGSTFASAEIDRVRALLPDLTMARVSFRAPWVPEGLGSGRPDHLWSRVKELAGGARPLERLDLHGDVVEIRDRALHREMVAVSAHGEFVWSRAERREPQRSGWFYVDLFHLAAARAKSRSRVLLIGCGGGVSAQQFATVYPGTAIDIVERDSAVVGLARRWCGLDDVPNVKVIVDDGRAFLARVNDPTWDVVVIDAYGAHELAPGFVETGFFTDLKRVLRPGGGFAFNTLGTLSGCGELRDVERAARRAFADVRLVPVLDPGEAYSPSAVRNIVVIGRNGAHSR